jgi:hypothetical protein
MTGPGGVQSELWRPKSSYLLYLCKPAYLSYCSTPFTHRHLVGLAREIEGKMVKLDMSLSELTARAYARALPARKVGQDELRADIIVRQLT